MSAHGDTYPSSETAFSPETPGTFRIGEVITARAYVDENGMFVPGGEGIRQRSKLIVTDIYQGMADTPDLLVTMDFDDSSGLPTITGGLGSTEWGRNNVSLGIVVPRVELVGMALRYALKTDVNPDPTTISWTRMSALLLVDIVEQSIADKVARGEAISEKEVELDHNRRVRDANPATRLCQNGLVDTSIDIQPYIDVL